ncbi:MAG: response regulator [Pseudomonadota bacterium]
MGDTTGKTVLIVDDEPDVRLYLETILKNAGFDVMAASNGRHALDRMTEKKPDVISLDLVMPKMSGFKFFKYIQKNKERAGIPVVVVTAHGKDELGQKALEKIQSEPRSCKLFYLEKPVVPAEYVNTVRKALSLPAQDVEEGGPESLRSRLIDKIRTADPKALKAALKALKD